MALTDLIAALPGPPRRVADIVREWQVAECADALRDAGLLATAAGGAAIIGDALRGGSTIDNLARIPPAVQEAFQKLMGVSPGDYEHMSKLLSQHVSLTKNGSIAFDDKSLVGFINKLKGQIGENMFVDHVGPAAQLAQSGSQAGWDVAVRQGDGAFKYVQVKLCGDASDVVRHMRSVQERLVEGVITGVDGQTIDRIHFAVPANIHGDVQRLISGDPQLAGMLYETPVPIASDRAANLVQNSMVNVSKGQLSQFFHQLLGGAAVAGSLHAAINAFLLYKGSKEFSEAVADTVTDTAVSTVGIAACLIAEQLCRTVVVAGAVGIGVRMWLGQMTRSRWAFGDFLEQSLNETRAHISQLEQLAAPSCRQ